MGTNSNHKKKSSSKTKKSEATNITKQKSKIISSNTSPNKKIWSFDSIVEAMKPSNEELEYRKEQSLEPNVIQKYSKLFKCTKCMRDFQSIVKSTKKPPIHPCLGVLMCQKCCEYYEDGEFSLDSEGEDKYCRWCGEGGTIFGCSKCICGFCAACIKWHFGVKFFRNAQMDDNWLCFFCNPKPLWKLRFICSLAVKSSIVNEMQNETKNITNEDDKVTQSFSSESFNSVCNDNLNNRFCKKRSNIISSDESEEEENFVPGRSHKKLKCSSIPKETEETSTSEIKQDFVRNSKPDPLSELKNILSLSQHQMSFGLKWSTKMLKKLTSFTNDVSATALLSECQKTKWFLSLMSTYLVQFSNSVDSIEKSLGNKDAPKFKLDCSEINQSPYNTILQFLGFVNNQVKIFMENGISFADVLKAEVYDDGNVIGIRKKLNCTSETCSQDKNDMLVESQKIISSQVNRDNKNSSEERDADLYDGSREESSSEIVLSQNTDMTSAEGDEEYNSNNFPSTSLGDTCFFKTLDTREEIQEILSILENV